ncbi:hypothetical protein Tco_1065378 [Tanacetum coccineum]
MILNLQRVLLFNGFCFSDLRSASWFNGFCGSISDMVLSLAGFSGSTTTLANGVVSATRPGMLSSVIGSGLEVSSLRSSVCLSEGFKLISLGT